jgi:hypothetical protein
MSNDEPAKAPQQRACKTLPPVALQWEPLPPMLQLEMQLDAGIDPLGAIVKIQAFLDALSGHYKSLGGEGLRYHKKQIANASADGMLRVALYPMESTDVCAQQDRLRQIHTALRSGTVYHKPAEVVRVESEVKLTPAI